MSGIDSRVSRVVVNRCPPTLSCTGAVGTEIEDKEAFDEGFRGREEAGGGEDAIEMLEDQELGERQGGPT